MPALGPIFFAALALVAQAQAPDAEDPGALYGEANRLKVSGDETGAARAYARAHVLLRQRDVTDGNTVFSLFEAVDLFLAAYARTADPALVCEARTLFNTYQSAILGAGKTVAPEVAELERRLSTVQTKSAVVCASPPPTSPAPPEAITAPPANVNPTTKEPAAPHRPEGPTPAPAVSEPPKRPRPTGVQIGAYTSFGVAGAGIALLAAGMGVGLSTQREGEFEATNGASAQELQSSVIPRGRTANGLGYAGVTLAAAGLATGVALLVVHRLRAGKQLRRTANGLVIPLF